MCNHVTSYGNLVTSLFVVVFLLVFLGVRWSDEHVPKDLPLTWFPLIWARALNHRKSQLMKTGSRKQILCCAVQATHQLKQSEAQRSLSSAHRRNSPSPTPKSGKTSWEQK